MTTKAKAKAKAKAYKAHNEGMTENDLAHARTERSDSIKINSLQT
jgi:hypothetical protein